MAPKVTDPKKLEQEYITTDISLRKLAAANDLSWSAVASRARREGWAEKREAYQDSVRRRTYEHTADKFAREQAEIRSESVIAMRATVREYINQLTRGEIKISPKDAAQSVSTLLLLLGEATSRSESKIVELTTGGLEPEFLRRLGELARARIVEGTVAEPPRSLLEGPRES